MPYGWSGVPQSPYDFGAGETIDVYGKMPQPAPFAPPTFRPPGGGGDYGGDGRSRGGGGDPNFLTPPDPSNPEGYPVPLPPKEEGEVKVLDWKDMTWQEKLRYYLNNFSFSMGGGGLAKLLQLLMKGYTLAEVIDELNNDPKKPTTPGGPGGGGGGGGGGGKGSFAGPSTVGAYQGLNHQPSFLSWQPTNAGAPMFSAGGPSSLSGSPIPPPPPPVKKNKKKPGS